jgi:TPR repeat protein
MTHETFNRVLRIRERGKLWLKASHLEDQADIKSQHEAVHLLKMVVRMGERDALGSLALAYDIGKGVRPSRRMTMHLYRKAWRSGSYISATNAGIATRNEGRRTTAIRWFKRAIAGGDPDASLYCAKLLLSIFGHCDEAAKLLEEFVAAGPQPIYTYGPGVTPEKLEDENFLEGQQLLHDLKPDRMPPKTLTLPPA